jgi:hypothetical protein
MKEEEKLVYFYEAEILKVHFWGQSSTKEVIQKRFLRKKSKYFEFRV